MNPIICSEELMFDVGEKYGRTRQDALVRDCLWQHRLPHTPLI